MCENQVKQNIQHSRMCVCVCPVVCVRNVNVAAPQAETSWTEQQGHHYLTYLSSISVQQGRC